MNRTQSENLFKEAKTLFPGGVNSPVRAFKSVHGAPLFISHGDGSRIYDEDGNEFIDFCNSWGPLILGHNNPKVREAIIEAVSKGTSFGTPTAIGNEIGRLIIEHHRYLEKIRFVSSGTEAVMSAIRLARGYTGKNKIIKFEGCYHGHVDSLLVKAGSGLATFGESTSAGIPASFVEETVVLSLNDLAGLEELLKTAGHDIAAVIIEPIPANNGLLIQDHNYLSWMRMLCDRYSVLLIFDEVISGFRVGFEGASGYYSIAPDIITFGKIIGGGMPVGAYGASEKIMSHVAPEGSVYQAGTLSANPVTLSAGLATLSILLEDHFYEDMANKTAEFVGKIQSHIDTKGYAAHVASIGSIFWIAFATDRIITAEDIDPQSMDYFKKLHAYLLDHGIYLGPSGYEVGFVSAAHTSEDLDHTASIINSGLDHIFAH